MLGIPALLVALFGVSALAYANYGLTTNLEARYRKNAEKSKEDKNKVLGELRTELRMVRAANRTQGKSVNEATIPEDDKRRLKLKKLQETERVYWEKLISLNPEELEYRFKLAIVSLEQGEIQRGLALMQLCAPSDEPGFAEAHLWLSRYYIGLRAESQTNANRNRRMALRHAEHCLTRGGADDVVADAKLIKAQLLSLNGRYDAAYEIFEELFEKKPMFYEAMIGINKRLKKEGRNQNVLDQAYNRFRAQLADEKLESEPWLRAWTHSVKCLLESNDFVRAEDLLTSEIQQLNQSQAGAAKRVVIEQLLSSVYLKWSFFVRRQSDKAADQLELLNKAYVYNSTNAEVLRYLARFAIGEDEQLAAKARQIYDPRAHVDAPAMVLNELGADALAKTEYEAAIRYFELARKKSPKNSRVLNNLAWTYLVCESRNPERALKLIDEGLRFLPKTETARTMWSHFYDTRGTALMQLNRMTEAVASFEIALQDRPNDRKILESLVKCYQGNNLSPDSYLARLQMLDEQDALKGSPANVPNGTNNQ